MLSISLPMHGVGHADYYLKLAEQDYYTGEGHEAGRWFGPGAHRLGLSGAVASQAYENLLRGRSIDGRQSLVQNAGDPNRQTGWDLTFSAPKSVSVLWALAPEEMRNRIVTAHREAVETALQFLEETAGLTRRGKGGARLEQADLTFATFLHKTSRALDPQLHTHCLLINLAVRADGTTGALWSKEFFRAKMTAGAIYQVQFAAGLSRDLGLSIQPDRIGFQVAEVPRELCRALSKRRQAIDAALDQRGARDAVTAKQVALDTRPRKVAVAEQDLRVTWQKTAEMFGWNQARAISLGHQRHRQPCSQENLAERFRGEAAKLSVEKQTPGRLLGLAAALAVELGADARVFRSLLRWVQGQETTKAQSQPRQQTAPVIQQAETHQTKTDSVVPTQAVADHARPAGQQSARQKDTGRQAEGKKAEQAQAQAREKVRADKASGRQQRAQRKSDRARARQSRQERAGNQHGHSTRSRASQRTRRPDWTDGEPGAKSRPEQNARQLDKLNPRFALTPLQRKKLFFEWKDFMASGRGPELFRPDPFLVSPRQARRNEQFVRALEDKGQKIPSESQTRQILTWHAVKLACDHGADVRTVYETLRDLRPGAERGLVHVEWRRLFPKAPSWSPVRNWKAPVIGVGGGTQRKWGPVVWKQSLVVGELHVQKRRLFRKAPKWSLVHGLEVPALRLRRNPTKSEQAARPAEKSRKKDQSHSQSH